MFGTATAAQRDTDGESMSHDQATGMMADEPRSSRTTATQFLDSVCFQAHWNMIRLVFTLRKSTFVTLRR
jgi:hypothetical protein